MKGIIAFRKSIVFFFVLLTAVGIPLRAAIPASERAALIALYKSTDGDNWNNNSGWKGDNNEADGFSRIGSEGSWYGITAKAHVTEIEMWNNNLTGPLPPELGNLSELTSMDFWDNRLSGSIPAELGNLGKLIYLFLGGNQLSGAIPAELGNLGKLMFLFLMENQLSGAIPAELGNLGNLIDIILSDNQLTGGIPSELGNLGNLEEIKLNNNQLSGGIPPELGNLVTLTELSLSSNQLSGSIPSELGNLGMLSGLVLRDNQLSGNIPSSLGNITDLNYIDLSSNQLEGGIPVELGNISGLSHLFLENNQLSGSIPSSLGNLTNLYNCTLWGNQLSGGILPELGNLVNLTELSLDSNQLSGSIPSELGNLTKLIVLDLSKNQLSGGIPEELGNLGNLEDLSLASNKLTGSIPSVLGTLTELTTLEMNYNRLSGGIPSTLGNLVNLRKLTLSSNQLMGTIPSSLTNLTNVHFLRLGYNGLYTNDETFRTFLNNKDPFWENSQTVAPSNVSAQALSVSSIKLSWTPLAFTGQGGGYNVYYSTTSGGPWTHVAMTGKNTASYIVSGLSRGVTYYFVMNTRTDAGTLNPNTIVSGYCEEASATTPATRPTISLNRNKLNFGYEISNNVPGHQTVTLTVSGGTLDWTASTDAPWLNVSSSSGTGSDVLYVTVTPWDLTTGTYTGAVTVSSANAENSPQTVSVMLKVLRSYTGSPPFGEFATPAHGSTVSSSIAVTGWALDDTGIHRLEIHRGEPGNLVYIGDAIFVEGARPDVEGLYPDFPMNYRAGWGYMMLTNFLPNGGNGTFKIHAVAADIDGERVTLGTKTIHCDNANAVKPFGAIDTPEQGGTVCCSDFRNHGWVLTPMPNAIPTDGSTINVYVDGVNLGHPIYDVYRSDIAEFFPGYANSSGAHVYFDLDTTAYENGVHSIFWTAADDAGNADGIGSRYFMIQNTGGSGAGVQTYNRFSQTSGIPMSGWGPVKIKKGFNPGRQEGMVNTGNNGIFYIGIEELGRLEIALCAGDCLVSEGYVMVGDSLRALPVGSTLDTRNGRFYWQLGPGFTGDYRLVFIEKDRDGRLTKKIFVIRVKPRVPAGP